MIGCGGLSPPTAFVDEKNRSSPPNFFNGIPLMYSDVIIKGGKPN